MFFEISWPPAALRDFSHDVRDRLGAKTGTRVGNSEWLVLFPRNALAEGEGRL